MIPARVLGHDEKTGKIYQAMRGEVQPKRWRWIEVTHDTDRPNISGDIVFNFSDIEAFPLSPPIQAKVDDAAESI
jgi:hypothetical protein